MSSLTIDEWEILDSILKDLQLLFPKDELLPEEIDDLIDQLESEETKSYLKSLKEGKPETALSDAFFAGRSVLKKYLFGDAIPEAVVGEGFIDYKVRTSGEKVIWVELKPLFEPMTRRVKAGRELRSLRQKPLKYEKYKKQILKYIQEGGEYIILTNLKDWIFFSKSVTAADFEPFASTDLIEFHKQFEVERNLGDYLMRLDQQSIREDLDKLFFESLKMWVNKLSDVKFTVDEKRKTELILNMINKFIFVQTLDDYRVIEPRWIQQTWNHNERRWGSKGKGKVLKEFFSELDNWFYQYYDTELFRDEVLNYVKQERQNLDLFHKNLRLVLGFEYWISSLGGFRGIIQYNFRYIDEDILGKAYETYLAGVRHEEGIYYTSKFITQYIVDNTIGDRLDKIVIKLREKIEEEDFEEIKVQLAEFISIRVLDPACGSGSFLIKAVRKIWEKYKEVDTLLREAERKHNKWQGSFEGHKGIEKKVEKIHQLMDILGSRNDRELISKILVRHIHGNDKDNKALDVAKLNIWLEAIKLSPSEFRYDKLPEETNYILPNLEMNLCNGDSIVGLPLEYTIRYLVNNCKDKVSKLFELRNKYLCDPSNPKLVERIIEVKTNLKRVLDEEFKNYLNGKQLPSEIARETLPFHWAFEFWYVFFKEKGEALSTESRGFDFVIGNPPYERAILISRNKEYYREEFTTTYGAYDIYVLFMERGIDLLKEGSNFGFIISNKYLVADYGKKLRDFLIEKCYIQQLMDLTECPSIFDKAMISPVITICEKSSDSSKQELKTKIAILKVDDLKFIPIISKIDNNIDCPNYSVEFRNFSELRDPTSGHLNVYLSGDVQRIMNKVYSGNKLMTESAQIRTGIMGFEYWNMEPLVRDGHEDEMSSTNEIKLLPPSLIDRYEILWGRKEVRLYKKSFRYPMLKYDSERINVNTWNLFLGPKIVVRGIARRLSAAIDDKGEYGILVAVHSIIPEKGYDFRFIVCLLNSALFNWIHITKFYSARIPQGSLRYPISFLKQLPLCVATERQQELLTGLFERIRLLKLAKIVLQKVWNDWSMRMKNRDRTLFEILVEDRENIRKGEFKSMWTSKATFFPDGTQKILSESFNGFKIEGSSDKQKMLILSLDDHNRERKIFEMEFNNKELMLHTFFSINLLMDSAAKVQTLSHIFNKTVISVIQPDIVTNTPNIVRRVMKEFSQWKQYGDILKIGVKNITEIDRAIEEAEANIDSLVFKLYNFDKNDVATVMDSLSLLSSYKEKVLSLVSAKGTATPL